MITAYQLLALNVDGYLYEITEPTHDGVGASVIVVKDPVQCSSGSNKWTETREVKLLNDAGVRRFLSERSGE